MKLRLRQPVRAAMAIAVGFLLVGSVRFHLDLVDSRPKENSTVAESPGEIWLLFNNVPIAEQSGISLRGPAGSIRLGPATVSDSLALSVSVTETLGPGEYTVSWLASAADEHTVRGRYKFTVSGDEEGGTSR